MATGRIGRPGMGPFSVTGQPNAMGGREVGGLANALTCHLDIENAVHRQAVQTFWSAPTMAGQAGLKAVDMFRAVEEGRIKAIWIICTNPAVSMPEAARIRRALAACDFVVVSDCMADTDTTRLADVVFPAATWGEREGSVTNSERCISRQRAFRASPAWHARTGAFLRGGSPHGVVARVFLVVQRRDLCRICGAVRRCRKTGQRFRHFGA
ncbi:molybdopterin-dependent oxidoreductase [Gemmobacter lanyuensis]